MNFTEKRLTPPLHSSTSRNFSGIVPHMRSFRRSTFLAALCLGALVQPGWAGKEDKKHDHDHATMAGPNGGRVLHEVHPHAELLVTKDRKLQITFLTAKGKATAPGEQTMTVICGKRTRPTRMSFARKGNSFLSDKALPKGLHIPTVIQVRMKPRGKSTIIRLNLNLEECSDCDALEYACVCDHHAHEKKPAAKPKK